MKILVVDDEKTLVKGMKFNLENEGYEVECAYDGAAGAVEAIVSILALRDGIVPPTIHLQEPDPACDLDYTPNTALHTPLDAALSVSLGFGGHNACVAFAKV